MKKASMALVAAASIIYLQSCATASYDTMSYRDASFDSAGIAVSPGGLTAEQADAILATKFPPAHPVSIAIFYVVPKNYYPSNFYDPVPKIIEKMKTIPEVAHVVPVPSIMMPESLTIEAIQQIGIRTLSEYSIVFYGNAGRVFFSYKSPMGQYMVSSTLEFMIVDNKTTAIIAADKLFTEFQTPVQLFSDEEFQKTLARIYEEQSDILRGKLIDLFRGE